MALGAIDELRQDGGKQQCSLGVRGRAPLIDLALFRERGFAVGILTVLVFHASIASSFFVLTLYLQQGRGLDALGSGATFTSLGLGYIATSLYARRIAGRLGRQSIAIGALIMALGLLLLHMTVAHFGAAGHVAVLVPALFVDGAGMGMVTAPLVAAVLAGIAPRYAGAASGVLATAQQGGNAIGVAVIGLVFYGFLGHTGSPGQAGRQGAYADAFSASLVYLIGLIVAVASLIQLLPRNRDVAESSGAAVEQKGDSA